VVHLIGAALYIIRKVNTIKIFWMKYLNGKVMQNTTYIWIIFSYFESYVTLQ
jgi:hypothetical protein